MAGNMERFISELRSLVGQARQAASELRASGGKKPAQDGGGEPGLGLSVETGAGVAALSTGNPQALGNAVAAGNMLTQAGSGARMMEGYSVTGAGSVTNRSTGGRTASQSQAVNSAAWQMTNQASEIQRAKHDVLATKMNVAGLQVLAAEFAVTGRAIYQTSRINYDQKRELQKLFAWQRPGGKRQRDPLQLMRDLELSTELSKMTLKYEKQRTSAAKSLATGISGIVAIGAWQSQAATLGARLTARFGGGAAATVAGTAARLAYSGGVFLALSTAFTGSVNYATRKREDPAAGKLMEDKSKSLGIQMGFRGEEQVKHLREVAGGRRGGSNMTLWSYIEMVGNAGFVPDSWMQETMAAFEKEVGGSYARAWKAMINYDKENARAAFNKARSWFKDDKMTPKSWREPEKTMLMVENSRITNRNYARSLNGRAKTRSGD